MTAIDVIGRIVPGRKLHAVGYCLGSTILAIAAAAMDRDHDDRLASLSRGALDIQKIVGDLEGKPQIVGVAA